MPNSLISSKSFQEVYDYISDANFIPEHFNTYIRSLKNQNIDISNVKYEGNTLLGKASERLNLSAIEVLLWNEANPTISTAGNNNKEWTPINWAIYSKDVVSLDPTIRLQIIDLILSKCKYDDLGINFKEFGGATQVPAIRLLIHGISLRSKVSTKALEQLSETLKSSSPEILAIQKLHEDTISYLESQGQTLDDIKGKAVHAILNGAKPSEIGEKYTQFSLDALNTVATRLSNLDNHDDVIQMFLTMSLAHDAKQFLSLKVDFSKIAEQAIKHLLLAKTNPLKEGVEVFSGNALVAISEVKKLLREDPSLFLYSNLHDNLLRRIGDQVRREIQDAAIEKLKNGENPRMSDGKISDHAKDLIAEIANDIKKDVAQWFEIKKLHEDTRVLIDEELKSSGSSIEIIEEEIQNKLKNGELGEVFEEKYNMMPNAEKAIHALWNSLKQDESLYLRVNLGENVEKLLKYFSVELELFTTRSIEALIKDEINPQNDIKFTDTLYKTLKSQPEKMLYIRDKNIEKIKADLGESKFDELRNDAINAAKIGAPHLLIDHMETTFAHQVFLDIIKLVESYDLTNINSFTVQGLNSVSAFANGISINNFNKLKTYIESKKYNDNMWALNKDAGNDGILSAIWSYFSPPKIHTKEDSTKVQTLDDVLKINLSGEESSVEEA